MKLVLAWQRSWPFYLKQCWKCHSWSKVCMFKNNTIFIWSHKLSSVAACSVFLFRLMSGLMDGRNISLIIENHLPGVLETVSRLIEMALGACGDRTEHNSIQRLSSRFVLFMAIVNPARGLDIDWPSWHASPSSPSMGLIWVPD